MIGRTPRVETGCGNLYVVVSWVHGKIAHVILKLGRAGGCDACFLDGSGLMINRLLAEKVPVKDIILMLRGQRCHKPIGLGPNKVLSCYDGVGMILEEELERGVPVMENIGQGDGEKDESV